MRNIACLIVFAVIVTPCMPAWACTLTVSSTGGGSVTTPGEGSFYYGQTTVLEIVATAAPDYRFVNWTGTAVDAGKVANPDMATTTLTLDQDYTLHANFTINVFTIIASAGPNGTIDPDGVIVKSYGEQQQFTATPDLGYKVDRWYLDGNDVEVGSSTYTLSNIQADHTVQVTFERIRYTITPSAGPNGGIHPDLPINVGHGDFQWFRAYPATGYSVDTWFVDGNDVQNGGATYMLSNVQADHTVHVTFRQLLSYSLNDIDFSDDEEFSARITHNNYTDPDDPSMSRDHVVRVVGLGPEPDGVMQMRNLQDLDPTSPNYGAMITARAKAMFAGTDADEIFVQFKYLFDSSEPGVELVAYLSDVPELLDHGNPRRERHYREFGRIAAPPVPRPGSAGSDHFGVFEEVVWTAGLDLVDGTWIELELIGATNGVLLAASYTGSDSTQSEGTSVYIDDWEPAVQCYGICLDISWDNFVDEVDFLMVISKCGYTATGEQACLDGAFSTDGYVDSYDLVSWDWAMNSEDRLLNFCGLPLVNGGMSTLSVADADFAEAGDQVSPANLPANLSDLLILGKRGISDAPSKLKDRIYAFDSNGLCVAWSELPSQRCNVRVVQGHDGKLYQVNCETGVLRLDDTNEVIVGPGAIRLTGLNEPRYDKPATVYVGIQDRGADSFGRPILDAAIDANYVYAVPVVVSPDDGEPYEAAAKLQLLSAQNPPYQVVQLYDDPPIAGDNQYRDALREIEIDGEGNVYVVNVHRLNESDILWRYEPNGTVERLDLGRPNSSTYLPAPIAMHMSRSTDMLYLASARYNPVDASSTVIYCFSTKGALALERSITINGMHHVTSITEDPAGAEPWTGSNPPSVGSLWVVGFNIEEAPLYPNPAEPPFYHPYLAEIPHDSNSVHLISLFDPASHDLALPMSIVWTAQTNYGSYDSDHSSEASFMDFAIFADYWLYSGCASPQ